MGSDTRLRRIGIGLLATGALLVVYAVARVSTEAGIITAAAFFTVGGLGVLGYRRGD